MTRKPTKAQKQKQELVGETINVALAAGAQILQNEFEFSDLQSGQWILSTAALLARHIGTDEARAEIEAARHELEGDD